MPFGLLTGVHRLGVPTQMYPGSTSQVAEQPSPFTILKSSHCSFEVIMPSPQVAVHTLGVPVHVKPCSTLQADEHPSLSVVLMSSQVSTSSTMPFPQV